MIIEDTEENTSLTPIFSIIEDTEENTSLTPIFSEEGWQHVLSLFSDGSPHTYGSKSMAPPGLPGYPDDPFSPNNTDDFVVPPSSCASGKCAYEKEVLQRFLDFPSGPVPYFPVGPNSNSFADHLTGGAGAGVNKAPGIGNKWP